MAGVEADLMLRNLLLALVLCIGCGGGAGLAGASGVSMDKAPHEALARLARGEPQDLIVVFDDQPVRRDAAVMQAMRALPSAHQEIIAYKAARYAEQNQRNQRGQARIVWRMVDVMKTM